MKKTTWLLCLAMSVVMGACWNQSARKEITETRTVTTPSVAEHGSEAVQAPAMDVMRATPEHAFTWTAPEGWTEVSATAMRIANFRIGPGQETECYVSVLKGSGGGVELNVNRWRSQMGLEGHPVTAEEIANLPRIKVAGHDAPLVEVSGEYRGMTGKAQSSSMLLGTICELGNESVFVKMVGPEPIVKAEREKFIAFCGSLK